MRSPCGIWNSTPSSPGHSKRPIPRCGRCSVVPRPSSSATEDRERRVAQEDEPPPGPQKPRGLRDPAVRVDPDRRTVLRDDEIELTRRAGRSRRHRPRRAETRSGLAMQRRALSSCAGVMSTPTGRAPALASHAETYAVPQPSSTTSRPSTSPITPSSASGICQMPQCELAEPASSAFGRCTPCWSSSRARDSARRRVRPVHRGTRARSRARPTRVSRSRARGCSASRARTRHAASPGRLRRGSSRRSSCGSRDRALALEHERERRPRGDEVDELAEERLLRVLGVVRLAELARRSDEPGGAQLQAAALEAREDLAGEAALDGVRLREDQGALDGHAAAELSGRARRALRRGLRSRQRHRLAADRRLAVRADLPRGLERPVAHPARLAEFRRADRAHEEVGVDRATADRALLLTLIEPPLHRLDLELALAHILEVLGRAEEHVDERPEERRDRADHRRDPDQRGSRTAGGRPCRPSRPSRPRRRETNRIARVRITNHVAEWKKSCTPPKTLAITGGSFLHQPAPNASPTEGEEHSGEDEDAKAFTGARHGTGYRSERR